MSENINTCEHDALGDEHTCFACGSQVMWVDDAPDNGHFVEVPTYQRRWGAYNNFALTNPQDVRPLLPSGDTWLVTYCNACAHVCVGCDQVVASDNGYEHPLSDGDWLCSNCWGEDFTLCYCCDATLSLNRDRRRAPLALWHDDQPYCEDHCPEDEPEYDDDYDDYYDSDRRSGRSETLPNGRYLIMPYQHTDENDPFFNHTEYVPLPPLTSGRYGTDGNFEVVSIKRFNLIKHSRVPDKFPGIGYELELKIRETALRNKAARFLLDGVRDDYLILKEDCSVNGWEQVTYVADYRAHMELYPWDKLPELANRYTMYAWNDRDRECGLHVHISRSAFRPSHLHRFVTFHDKHSTELIQFAGRNSVGYAQHGRRYDDNRVAQALGTQRGYARHVAVNLAGVDTVELRYFRGSLKPSTVKACVQFTHALWAWTKELDSKDVRAGAFTFNKFIDFANEHTDEYPDLAPRFVERGFVNS